MAAHRDPDHTPAPQGSQSRPKRPRPAKGPPEDPVLDVEELEERIAPELTANHNQTVLTED